MGYGRPHWPENTRTDADSYAAQPDRVERSGRTAAVLSPQSSSHIQIPLTRQGAVYMGPGGGGSVSPPGSWTQSCFATMRPQAAGVYLAGPVLCRVQPDGPAASSLRSCPLSRL